MNHLDIKEGQYKQNSKMAKNYFWPFPFSMPMRDPYYTGPMSEPVLSPAGGIVMPRRNPYYTKPTNPFLNPYNAQYRHTMWPVTQSLPRTGTLNNSCPHHGPYCPTPRSGGFMPPINSGFRVPGMGPMGPRPPRGPRGPRGPMGPMGPMGYPPMGPMMPPPTSPYLFI